MDEDVIEAKPRHGRQLGEAVRRRREALGLTQEQLAEAMGGKADGNYITHLETGRKLRLPEQPIIGQLARGLGTSEVELLRVERQLIEVKGGGLRVGPPKTAKSKRVLPMAAAVMAVLADHRKRQEARKAEGERLGTWDDNDGWIFDIGDGGPQHPRTAFDRFKRACRRAGVPVIRLHDLRGSGITLMVEAGVHQFVVQERAGHTSAATTFDYVNPSIAAQRVAAEALAGLLGLGSEDVVVEVRPAAD